MLQDRGNIAGILPINRIEIEVLKTERHVKLVAPDRTCAFAENRSQGFLRRRREGFKRRVVCECDT